MQVHDFISVRFRNDTKTYYAEVKQVNADNTFDCRFVHTGSQYTFKTEPDFLKVVKSTGMYKPGTITGDVTLFTETNDTLNTGTNVAVTFDDGNTYLGVIESLSPMQIKFLHSGNEYTFDADKVAQGNGLPYDGRRALAMKPFSQGKSLFSNETALFLNLNIKDEFGNPLRGEFDVKIQQSNPNQEIYSNSELSAENSMAEDALNITGKDGQPLTLFIAFHPAVLPFNFNARESSVIDRDTTLATTCPFQFDAGSKALNFDITMLYDHTTVTATTKQEAIKTVYNQVTTNNSHAFEVKFGGEAAIELFGVGGKLSGGGTTTDTTGTGTIGGDTTGDVTGGSTATTYTVNFPKGLQVKFSKN